MYTVSKLLKQDGRTCISEKRLKKRAAEHVYCLKYGKTGWQNLYIGKKIEKRGWRNMYTV